ncbi:MAG: creatininase family protein [Alistipes shahii]
MRAWCCRPVSMGSQNPGQRELPFCIHARYETQKAILTDIASSLRAQGMRRLVIVNGHGGNCFKNMIRRSGGGDARPADRRGRLVCGVPGAGLSTNRATMPTELETSVMMHYHPELVNLAEAGPGTSKPLRAHAELGKRWRGCPATGGGCRRIRASAILAKATAGKGRLLRRSRRVGRFAGCSANWPAALVYRD